jgi:hypothetical protein
VYDPNSGLRVILKKLSNYSKNVGVAVEAFLINAKGPVKDKNNKICTY